MDEIKRRIKERRIMTIELLKEYLLKVYSKDTCYSKCIDNWNMDNPTLGHCAIVSLLVTDYFGGDIYKIKVDGISHYFNIINNQIIDLTSSQFNRDIDYTNRELKTRKEVLNSEETKYRYNLLKKRLELLLIDTIYNKKGICNSISQYYKLFKFRK